MGLLTLIIGKLQIVVHGGHEFLHGVAAYDRGEGLLALNLAFQNFYIMI